MSTSPSFSPLLLSRREAATKLGVSPDWLKQEVTAGRVQCTKVGRLVKFSQADMDAFIAARTVKAVNRVSA